MRLRRIFYGVLAVALLGGCASVSRKKQQRVDQINQVGVYGYQRAIGGPPR